jgi:hypothetical protein
MLLRSVAANSRVKEAVLETGQDISRRNSGGKVEWAQNVS